VRELKHVLVTGAAGFVGRELCRLLQRRGVRVRGADLAGAAGPWDEFQAGDLLAGPIPDALCRGVDTVFHLAALTHDTSRDRGREEAYRALNVTLTGRLVEAAVRAGVGGFLLTSSIKVCGEGNTRTQDESDPPRPASLYGKTKLAAEELVLDAGARRGIHAAVLRMPLIYGPGVKGNLAAMIRALDRGRFPRLPESAQQRSLVHVRDVAAALVLAAEHPAAAGEVFLVTDGRPLSSRRIADAISAALGKRPPRWGLPDSGWRALARLGDLLQAGGLTVPWSSEHYGKLLGGACYSSVKIENTLGFKPSFTFESSLPEMVAAARDPGGIPG